MALLHVAVLGKPQLRHGGAAVSLGSVKATALLCYLAVTGEPHSRSALAGLLWGGLTESRARTNLRLALHQLRRAVEGHLRIGAHTVALDLDREHWVDRRALDAALASPVQDTHALRAAVAAHRGEFCADLPVRNAPEFEAWLAEERDRSRRLLTTAFGRLVDVSVEAGELEEGIDLARRMVELDPLDEGAHRRLMEALEASGRRSGALAQYETCRHILADELGVDPSPATTELRDRLLRADATRPAAPPDLPRVPTASGTALAEPDTPLVGRDDDLVRLERLLEDEHARLVTLVGPGGVGKTRLALAAANHMAPRFAAGVALVPLAGIAGDVHDPAEAVAVAIADAAGAVLSQGYSARHEVPERLADQSMLVVLDNLEHLDATAFVDELLRRARKLVILATTRSRLGLGAEWVVDVGGLPLPALGATGVTGYPAVQLFGERARRVHPGFDLEAAAEPVARICRTVGGLPLAIELAADLMRSLPPDSIADRLAGDLDLLATTSAVVAPRHRSMRSVLETSWSLLDPDEQAALARLSVFYGGFDTDAALAVTGKHARVFAAVVDRGLVTREGERFGLHELLREFAAERLADDPADAAAARHAAHFAGVLAAHGKRLTDAADTDVVALLEADLANFRQAAAYLARHGDEDVVGAYADRLWLLYERKHRFAEAVEVLQELLARPELTPWLRARWHRLTASAWQELGRFEDARHELLRALEHAGHPLPSTRVGVAARGLGQAARQLGHRLRLHGGYRADPPSAAAQAASEAVKALVQLGALDHVWRRPETTFLVAPLAANIGERRGGPTERALGYAGLTIRTSMLGRWGLSRRYADLVLEAVDDADDRDAAALALLTTAGPLVSQGLWDGAVAMFERASALAAATGHRRRWEDAQGMLAVVEHLRGRFAAAAVVHAEVRASAEQRGERRQVLSGLVGEAQARLRADGDPDAAATLYEHASQVGQGLPVPAGLACVRLRQGRLDEAAAHVREGLAKAERRTRPAVYHAESFFQLAEAAIGLCRQGGGSNAEPLARAALVQLQRFTRAHPVTSTRLLLLRGELALAQGRAQHARRAFVRAVSAAERVAMPYEEARAHAGLGQALPDGRRSRLGRSGREHRARARELFAELGAAAAASDGHPDG